MFSIAAAPAKQSVGDTISVLSGRLSSASLLEDRRAAILGLRSFAKGFPASVASGALRSLIECLTRDSEDVDTVRVVLETLLMLFTPDDDSPESSEELMLWLADEFTQRQENVTLLLRFIDSPDFQSRLYVLQLVSAILSARTQRKEECILTAPLGVSRLVAALDDDREAVRDEAVALLIGLTPTSVEMQKLVAFEGAFERGLFIIEMRGSLSEGGRVVEDCLILLSNLLRRNPSNKALFRESSCMAKLARLLDAALEQRLGDDAIAAWAEAQRNRNLYAFFAVVRLFLTAGSAGVVQNQEVFWKLGLVQKTLQLAFSPAVEHLSIKAEALITCGDMIRSAPSLQEKFAQLTIPCPQQAHADTGKATNGLKTAFVIDGLLDLILNNHDPLEFNLRYAACECLKAYFSNHSEIRLHFLSRAISGYQGSSDDSANVLTALLQPERPESGSDPYRQWFAAVISFHLLQNNPKAKKMALVMTEGDEGNGEEVVTSVQTITAQLITGYNRGDDPRSLIGYLMLLLGWLFEDLDAVQNFLTEGSNVQSLIQALLQPLPAEAEIVQGLIAMLLGVAYEFSTKDCPLSRSKLHSILTSRLSRERYLDYITVLRSHPLLRDFEVTPQKYDANSPERYPSVFFDAAFVGWFKDNFGRMSGAIDQDPRLEVSLVTDGVQKGISRDLVDSLRSQVGDKERALEDAQAKITILERALEERKVENQRSRKGFTLELEKAQRLYEELQNKQEVELRMLQDQQASKTAEYEKRLSLLRAELDAQQEAHRMDVAEVRMAAQALADRARSQDEAKMADLRASISRLEVDLVKAEKKRTEDLDVLRQEYSMALAEQDRRTQELVGKMRDAESQLERARAASQAFERQALEAETARREASESKEEAQSELDDVLMLLNDSEEKAAKYKERLREMGEPLSDSEEKGDEADGEEVDDD